MDKDLADLYNIPIDIIDINDKILLYTTGFLKFCNCL